MKALKDFPISVSLMARAVSKNIKKQVILGEETTEMGYWLEDLSGGTYC